MAFPIPQTSAQILQATDTTTHNIPMPSGIVNNDILLVFIAFNGAPTISAGPVGYTQLTNAANSTSSRLAIYWKRASGTETAKTITTSTGEQSAGRIWRISGAHTTQAPEAGTAATGSSVNPNAPTLNPAGWDVEDTLYIASHAGPHGQRTVTTWPTSYTTNQNYDRTNTAATGSSCATAMRNLAAASDDPANWVMSSSLLWVAQTVAIRPAPAAAPVNTQVDVALGDPVDSLTTGAASGEIRARFRKKGTGADPQGRIELRNASGSWSTTVIPNTTITQTDLAGQLLSGTFDQSIITDKTDVLARFVGTGASGGTAELVALEWNALTEPVATPVAGASAPLSYSASALAQDTNQILYSLSGSSAQVGTLRYNASSLASGARGAIFSVSGVASKAALLRFDSLSRSQQSRTLAHDVLRLTTQSRQALYSLSGLSQSARQALYSVYTLSPQKSGALRYDVLFTQLLAGTDGALSYDLLSRASALRPVRFDIYTRTNGLRTLTYDVSVLAASERALSYSLASHASFATQVLYQILGLPQRSAVLSYGVRAFATDSNAISFGLFARAGAERSYLYDVRALASGSELVGYDVMQTRGSEGTLLYDLYILGPAAPKNGSLRFGISGLALTSREARYSVAGRALSSPALRYDVLFALPKHSTLGYEVYALLAPQSRSVRYSINAISTKTSIILYDILVAAGLVGKSGSVIFGARDIAESLGPLLYGVSARAQGNGALGFDLRGRSTTVRALTYALRSLSGASRTTLYDALAHAILVSALRELRYDLRGLTPPKSGAASFKILGLARGGAPALFDVRGHASGPRNIRYHVSGLSQAGRVVRFDVTVPVGIRRTIHYDLGGYIFTSRSMLYRVERLGAEFMVLVQGEVLPASAILDESLWPVTLLQERMEAAAELRDIEMEAATELGQKKLIVATRLEEDISPA